jgi:DNA invertase Pin-like site-specific DNA recombinase
MEKDDALHAQEKECRSYAKTHFMEVTGVYYDPGISGMTADRPGWQAMMHALKNALAPHGMLISNISRLARDVELCDRLQDECKRLGHTIIIVDDGAAVSQLFGKTR